MTVTTNEKGKGIYTKRGWMFRIELPPDEYQVLCLSVYQRDGWRCRACKSRSNLQAHHVQYKSQGGPDASWNMATLCHSCHGKIHLHHSILVVGDNADIPGRMKFLRMSKSTAP